MESINFYAVDHYQKKIFLHKTELNHYFDHIEANVFDKLLLNLNNN
jgi:hypothetical protein